MKATTKLRLAQVTALLLLLLLFESLHVLDANGLLYLLVVALVTGAFYAYASSFRCPRCRARLFPPRKLATLFFPEKCGRCGHNYTRLDE
jgi:hypothetical protein